MSIDLVRARAETPGCSQRIHLNNAGAALMPQPVIAAVKSYFDQECLTGGYETARARSHQIEAVYASVARLIDCEAKEIALIENATRAWDMAFYAIDFKAGDRILTCVSDYASNHIPMLQVSKRTGAIVDVIPNDENGQVSLAALEEMIDPSVKLIAITHVPTNNGLVNPAQRIGEIANKHNILYLLDACQSVGQMPISVKEIGCDLLTATSRKFLRGPRGQGFLYVRSELISQLEPPFLDLHSATWTASDEYSIRNDARRFETWETDYAVRVGMGAAIDYAMQWGLEAIWQRVQSLAQQLRTGLAAIPGVRLHDIGETQCGIITFGIDGKAPADIQKLLESQRFNVSVGHKQDTLLDMQARGLDNFLRASVHYYNADKELDSFCAAIKALG